MTTRQIYWLIEKDSKTRYHSEKIRALRALSIKTVVLRDFDNLIESYKHHRTTTVVIGDEFPESVLEAGIMKIIHHPEFTGTRMILSYKQCSRALLQKVLQLGFRDIMPIDMNDQVWVKRFLFSSGNKGSRVPACPTPQVTTNAISAIQVPTRIVWIDRSRLRIETKMKLEKGNQVKLIGGLADYLGVKSLTARIINHHTNNLKYRFSDSYICQWTVPEKLIAKQQALFRDLMNSQIKTPHSAYLAISDYNIRKALIEKLSSLNMTVQVALHKKSMLNEPRYISPNIIFIEDKLARSFSADKLAQLLKAVPQSTVICFIGQSVEHSFFKRWQQMYDHEFLYVTEFGENFLHLVHTKMKKIAPDKDTGPGFYLPRDHPLSYEFINVSARVTKIHPDSAEIVLSQRICPYSLITIESPFLSKVLPTPTIAKVSGVHKSEADRSFPMSITCNFSGISQAHRTKLAYQIIRVFEEKIFKDIKRDPEEVLAQKIEAQVPPIQKSEELEEIPIIAEPVVARKPKGPGFIKKFGRDLLILILCLAAIFAVSYGIFYYTPPVSEQGKVYSEQLLKFQQRFQNND